MKQGCGSRLIQRTFAAETGGSATATDDLAGLVCVIAAPIRGRVAPVQPIEGDAS